MKKPLTLALLLASITLVVWAGTSQVDNMALTGGQTVGGNITAASVSATGNTITLGTATNGNASITGKVLAYNGDTTAGNGVGSIVGSVALTGQTVTIAATTIYTTTAAGEYMIAPYTMVTATGSAGTLTTSVLWTDENGAQTVNVASSISVVSPSSTLGAVRSFHCTSGSAIRYSTALTGATGSPQYAFYVTVIRLR